VSEPIDAKGLREKIAAAISTQHPDRIARAKNLLWQNAPRLAAALELSDGMASTYGEALALNEKPEQMSLHLWNLLVAFRREGRGA
jgi:hypothetical protein